MEDGNTQAIFSQFQKAQNARPVRGVPNNRLLDGMSTSLTRKLDTMSRQELIDLRERNEKLLNNPGLMTTLPDKGEKLKNSIEQIDELLRKQDIADGMLGLSVSPPSSNTIRKRSVDQAMELADNATNSTSSLLATKATEFQPKTRMMSMDESMKLQEAQQQQVKDEKIKRQLQALKPKAPRTSESLADDLSLSMTRMQLDPETGPHLHRPQDDDPGSEYDEPDSDDQDSIDEANYDSLYDDDDEGFEEEDSENERN